jgi:hypothetical protein
MVRAGWCERQYLVVCRTATGGKRGAQWRRLLVRGREDALTGKSDFADEEWKVVLEGPPTAGMIVMTAEGGGRFRETWALAQAYAEARKRHGESELLDEIVSARPEIDRTRYHSADELKQQGLTRLGDASELVARKAAPAEVDEYRKFVVNLATEVANAHKEQGG